MWCRRGGLPHGAPAFRLTRSRKIPMAKIERASFEDIGGAIARDAHKGRSVRGGEEAAVTEKITQAEYRSFQKAFDFFNACATRDVRQRLRRVLRDTPPDRELSKFS